MKLQGRREGLGGLVKIIWGSFFEYFLNITCLCNPSIFCMILTQPRTTFKQADFFTKWLSYGPLIAKKSPKLNSMGRGPKIDHAHFRMTRTGEF